MNKKSKDFIKKIIKNIYFERLAILILSFTFVLIIVISPIYFYLDSMSYDLLLRHVKKPIAEDPSLVIVEIDDNAFNMDFIPYSDPWPRFIHGDAVEVMADFGIKAIVFDIEFLGKSVAGVNMDEAKSFEKHLQNQFQLLQNDFIQATSMIANNPSMQKDLDPIWNGYTVQLNQYLTGMNNKYSRVLEDNDSYFAKRIRYCNKVFGTVNMEYRPDYSDDDISKSIAEQNKRYLDKFGIDNYKLLQDTTDHPVFLVQNIAEFPEKVITDQLKGVGFTSVDRDKDGGFRRIAFFREKDNKVISQLAIEPFLKLHNIKPEQFDFSHSNYILINDVEIKGVKQDLKIPIDKNGQLRINWPSGKFNEIFISNDISGHLSYAKLLNYKYVLLENLSGNLENFSQFSSDSQEMMILTQWQEFWKVKDQMVENEILDQQSLLANNSFLDNFLAGLLEYTSENTIQIKENEINQVIEEYSLKGEELAQWQKIKSDIRKIYQAIHQSALLVNKTRQELKKELNDKICFIGLTATGTTDISPNPFDSKFINVGAHPSVYNMMLQNNFIQVVPHWVIFIVSLLFFGIMIWFLISKTEAVFTAGFGVFSTIVIVITCIVNFRMTNLYISPVTPFLYGIISFLLLILVRFLINEREKYEIRNAFDRYLAPQVINDLLRDPSNLELGGETLNCTAIFTDIEGFSSISEKYMQDMKDPRALINLLNEYLTAMTDIILDNRGLIDKYEGDAIIGIFGAPGTLSEQDHAYHACLSSIRMKQAEKQLNKHLMKEKISEYPLFTRIGINTGDMVVGNMGSIKRMDYSMIGHSVNLAARLEGVNKQYKTYQLISEYTEEKIRSRIMTRKLDRVRVVNIKTPIRLYELIGVMDELSDQELEALDTFDQALKLFEEKDFKNALKIFKKSCIKTDLDNPVDIYIKRCQKFIDSPPPENWDGVYSLTVK
ncbi:MAG: CHASE2 domain-containing protein [Spirochaetes bacterium]|nr:CHASE2 domain-containing protein [Spirochaetota bacterium]